MGGFVSSVSKKLTGYEKPQVQQIQREAVRQEPAGPTRAEMADKTRLASNRRGRRALILKSTTGVDENLTLGRKTLLGS